MIFERSLSYSKNLINRLLRSLKNTKKILSNNYKKLDEMNSMILDHNFVVPKKLINKKLKNF
jgi:hypothetical protein